MKFQVILIISVLLIVSQNVISYKTSLRQQKQQQEVLPTTPKGSDLQNNYGQPPNNNLYGANLLNQNRVPGQTQLTVLKPDGKIEQIQVNSSNLNKVKYTKCQISQDPHYQLCQQISDCDLCSNNDVCGWCAASQQCLPGNIGNAQCPGDCISHWIFEKGSCNGKVKSGSIGNVAVDAKFLITPEYAEPKVKVNTITTEHATVNSQVQVGIQRINQTIKVQSLNGTLVSQSNQQSIPIMGNLQKQIPISKKTESATYSLSNGQRLDSNSTDQKQTFGTQ